MSLQELTNYPTKIEDLKITVFKNAQLIQNLNTEITSLKAELNKTNEITKKEHEEKARLISLLEAQHRDHNKIII